VSLFGGVDLFGASDNSRPAPPAKAPSPPTVAPAKAPLKGTSLFGDDDDMGGLFTPIKTASPAAASAAPKQTSSLFGGGDDLFAVKPRAVKATASKAVAAPLFGSAPLSNDDLFGAKPAVVAVKPAVAPTPSPTAAVVASPVKPALSDPLSGSPSSKGGKIASLGAGINFNPAMLLGGGRPTPKAAPEPEVRVTESGTVEVANAGKRLGDEATQGAKVNSLWFFLFEFSIFLPPPVQGDASPQGRSSRAHAQEGRRRVGRKRRRRRRRLSDGGLDPELEWSAVGPAASSSGVAARPRISRRCLGRHFWRV
jgi:hypothetical protein